jgi:hypothetical protein
VWREFQQQQHLFEIVFDVPLQVLLQTRLELIWEGVS